MTEVVSTTKPSPAQKSTKQAAVELSKAPGAASPTIDTSLKGHQRVKAKSRARPRRRVAASDVESEADDAASDDSLTEHSSISELSDDEEDEDAVEDAVDHPSPDPDVTDTKIPRFTDIFSNTPDIWADGKLDSLDPKGEIVEMSFEEFNRGEKGQPVQSKVTAQRVGGNILRKRQGDMRN